MFGYFFAKNAKSFFKPKRNLCKISFITVYIRRMKMTLPNCPMCDSAYTYEDRDMYVCPECGHEWKAAETEETETGLVVKDANGNLLQEGDSVTVIKDLKVKGASGAIKQGTKVKNIRLVEGDHNIDCKVDGFGPMKLKSEFVKKN
ncbi:putative alkylphosphonate utilization operon protein PhnA [Enterococcus faecalis 13-SD-W-01]|nr:putative alkylphosphonate utilization operon protein PhnA [Enterococcus faecalis 13-SD-W-01]